jgi:lysozyme family protein
MSNFSRAIPHILEHEGGFVNHKNDPGGATNYGVSLRYLTKRGDLLGDFDGDGDVDIDDILAMTEEHARAVYRAGFWDPNKLDQVKSQLVAGKIFDMCVNMGSKQAWKIAQRAAGALGQVLIDDGVVGQNTLRGINALDHFDYDLVIKIRELQKAFYTGIMRRKPKLQSFALGWYRRAAF